MYQTPDHPGGPDTAVLSVLGRTEVAGTPRAGAVAGKRVAITLGETRAGRAVLRVPLAYLDALIEAAITARASLALSLADAKGSVA